MRWSFALLATWSWAWCWLAGGLPAREWWVVALPFLVLGLACLCVEVLDAQATRMVEQYIEDTDPDQDQTRGPRA